MMVAFISDPKVNDPSDFACLQHVYNLTAELKYRPYPMIVFLCCRVEAVIMGCSIAHTSFLIGQHFSTLISTGPDPTGTLLPRSRCTTVGLGLGLRSGLALGLVLASVGFRVDCSEDLQSID